MASRFTGPPLLLGIQPDQSTRLYIFTNHLFRHVAPAYALAKKKYGKNPKIDIPHEGGVLVIGDDVTKKPKYNTAASFKARQWKAEKEGFGKKKISFLGNFLMAVGGLRRR